MRRENGFSLVEILTVMVIIAIVVSMAIPRFGDTLAKQSVRGARTMITTMHARARATAVSRGSRTTLAIADGKLAITSRNPQTGVNEVVGRDTQFITDADKGYGVTFTVDPSTRASLVFDPRGLGTEASTTTIIVAKSGYADTITIMPTGRILH